MKPGLRIEDLGDVLEIEREFHAFIGMECDGAEGCETCNGSGYVWKGCAYEIAGNPCPDCKPALNMIGPTLEQLRSV